MVNSGETQRGGVAQMRTPELRDKEAITRMPVGAGACPLDQDVIDEIGDTDLWDELNELLAATVGAV